MSNPLLNVTGLAQLYGTSPEAMLVVVAFLASTGVAFYLAHSLGNKDVGILSFLVVMYIFAFFNVVPFIVVATITILVGVLIFYLRRNIGVQST